MREYELTVVYDLAVAESGGNDASVQHLTHAVEVRGGQVIKVDHWGRRRLAYPIQRALDADYVVTRVNLEPSSVEALEASFRIDEKVYRHLIVRADELPPPPPPREPRRQPDAVGAPAAAAAPVAPEAAAPVAAVPEAAAPAEPEAPASAAMPEAVAPEVVSDESALPAEAAAEPVTAEAPAEDEAGATPSS